ncbi:hypothetical protein R1flu_002515 [Riccia fluitans]|uniref:Uncharacterized protein n=1 Tax=Riccia fluitans TaxID=41844 RepID=A0ABD1Y6V5_9MARC
MLHSVKVELLKVVVFLSGWMAGGAFGEGLVLEFLKVKIVIFGCCWGCRAAAAACSRRRVGLVSVSRSPSAASPKMKSTIGISSSDSLLGKPSCRHRTEFADNEGGSGDQLGSGARVRRAEAEDPPARGAGKWRRVKRMTEFNTEVAAYAAVPPGNVPNGDVTLAELGSHIIYMVQCANEPGAAPLMQLSTQMVDLQAQMVTLQTQMATIQAQMEALQAQMAALNH